MKLIGDFAAFWSYNRQMSHDASESDPLLHNATCIGLMAGQQSRLMQIRLGTNAETHCDTAYYVTVTNERQGAETG